MVIPRHRTTSMECFVQKFLNSDTHLKLTQPSKKMETAIPCLIPSLTNATDTVVVTDRDTRALPSGYKTLTSSQEEMLLRITPGVALISPSTTSSQGHRHISALPVSPQLPTYRGHVGTANKAMTAGRLAEVAKIKRHQLPTTLNAVTKREGSCFRHNNKE